MFSSYRSSSEKDAYNATTSYWASGKTHNNLFFFSFYVFCTHLTWSSPPRKINTMRQPYMWIRDTVCLYSLFFPYVLSTWHRYVWLNSFKPNHLHTMRHPHLWIVGKCITICLYFSFCSYIFTKNTYVLLKEKVELLQNLFVFILSSIPNVSKIDKRSAHICLFHR